MMLFISPFSLDWVFSQITLMRSHLAILSVLVLFISAALSQSETEVMKIGFVYGTLPNDLSWTYSNDLGRAFLEFSRPQVKTKYVVTDYNCEPNSTRAIRELAEQDGYKMIVTASSVFETCTMEVAKEFPDKYFLCLGGGKTSGNYASAFGRLYEVRYANGVMAGLLTKTKKIAFIGSVPIYQVIF